MASLGKAVGILVAFERDVVAYAYEDLGAFHAPSECYDDVNRALARRFRLVRRRACKAGGVKNLYQLRRAVKKVCPTWDRYNHFRLGVDAI